MLTGRSPLEHGILDFTRFDPESGQRQPITSAERRVPAVWNIASTARRRVGVFGVWATYPAEPIDGTMISDRLFSFQHRQVAPPPGFAFPESAAEYKLIWAAKRLAPNTFYKAVGWLYRNRLGPFAN